ncbi:hypothetical protein PAF17_16880 [Paracoccus sp. Z330]|uniref:Uncharacterized protein n=1 Tax=Paracoccus onchidii TaxID=3017813 RepID=A0ABT4ZIH9_9RHOB|nr:hypothetical protein [Paracoccus onchidii]MDB6179167.1 hypothetical protein [Paracoccus onchidii]
MTPMALPQRAFYTVQEAALRWECALSDLAGWAATGKLEIVTAIRPMIQGGHVHAGFVVVEAADILELFWPGHGAPDVATLRRFRPVGTEDWILIESPADFVKVHLGRLMITVEEMHRFETTHGLMRRLTINNGAPSRHNWEGLLAFLIHRVHGEGVPATQGELIAIALDWFAQHSEGGDIPDESTIRRRLGPIWKMLRENA